MGGDRGLKEGLSAPVSTFKLIKLPHSSVIRENRNQISKYHSCKMTAYYECLRENATHPLFILKIICLFQFWHIQGLLCQNRMSHTNQNYSPAEHKMGTENPFSFCEKFFFPEDFQRHLPSRASTKCKACVTSQNRQTIFYVLYGELQSQWVVNNPRKLEWPFPHSFE